MLKKFYQKDASGFQGVSFGAMDGMITSLGIIVGLSSASQSAEVILIALFGAGIANSIANGVGFYVSEESEAIHSKKDMLKSAFSSFAASLVSVLLVSLPFVFFDILTAVILSILIIVCCLFYVSYNVSKILDGNIWKIFAKYLALLILVSLVSFAVGKLL